MTNWYRYYIEIRHRSFLIFLAWVSVVFTCYLYKETLLFVFVSFSNYTGFSDPSVYFIFTDVTEIFSVYAQLIFFIANQVLFIKLFYHSLLFLSLGLYEFEYNNLKFFLKTLLFSWFFSILFLNKILMPLSWKFFLSFHEQTSKSTIYLFFEAKLSEYFEYYINLYYACLINCQFLVFVVLFINNLSNDLNKIKTFRRVFYFIFVIFSTLTTPPDILSQLVVSLTLVVIYEILIFVKILKKI
jgi:sec-independent protein translocase protein TatC